MASIDTERFFISRNWVILTLAWVVLLTGTPAKDLQQQKNRARDLGIPFRGATGPLNAITDVAGIEVGHSTLISGNGKLVVGEGPIRTGVTAVLPRGKKSPDGVFAATFSLSGNGEMTGTHWIEESGMLFGPVMLTNTHSVGVVHDAVIKWAAERLPKADWSLPLVAETWDGFLNDINGFHVKKQHAFAALDSAKTGAVAEGNVGGGTGMRLHEFKGGIGTSSRVLPTDDGGYTVGVLVQANYGKRYQLRIAGVPVGEKITDLMPLDPSDAPRSDGNSIIIVVATDAPLLPYQLKRLAKRASLGLARTGSIAAHSSGDIFVAFSTANQTASSSDSLAEIVMLSNQRITPLFEATVQATEEAIINALIAARTMRGVNGRTLYNIPHKRVRKLFKKKRQRRSD